MAISADISDPLDDTKGGDSVWGHWQQDKRDKVVLTLDILAGAKSGNVKVKYTSDSIMVTVMGETRLNGKLFAKVGALSSFADGSLRGCG
jgi:hypothetical protein